MTERENTQPRPLTEEAVKARKKRNLWLALSLAAFVVAVLIITMIKISESGAVPRGGY